MASNSQIAFQPLGATHLLQADTPAPAAIQVLVNETTTGVGQYRIVNNGQDPVFLGVGATAAQAAARAAVIAAGTPSDTIVLIPGAVEVLRLNNNAWFTGFSANTTDVYITPGQGL